MPIGLGMALAMNPEAMQKFASLPEQEAYQVLAQKQFAYLSVQAAEYLPLCRQAR